MNQVNTAGLSDIRGIGTATEQKIRHKLDIHTPKELYIEYLTGNRDVINILNSTDGLDRAIMDAAYYGHLSDQDIGFDKKGSDRIKSLLFIRQNPISDEMIDGECEDSRWICSSRIEWDKGSILNRSKTVGIVFNEEKVNETIGFDCTQCTKSVEEYENHGIETWKFKTGEQTTWFGKEQIQYVNHLYGTNIPFDGLYNVKMNDEKKYPLKIEDIVGETSVIIAPRIKPED